jgi:hypothetical protein
MRALLFFIPMLLAAQDTVVVKHHAASAPAYVNSTTCSTGGNYCDLTITTGANHLVVFVVDNSTGTTPTLSVTTTPSTTVNNACGPYAAGGTTVEIFYAIPSGGVTNARVASTNNTATLYGFEIEFSNNNTTLANVLDQCIAATATGTAWTTGNAPNTNHANDVIVGGGGGYPCCGQTFTNGSGFTQVGTPAYAFAEYMTVSSTGAYAATAVASGVTGPFIMALFEGK